MEINKFKKSREKTSNIEVKKQTLDEIKTEFRTYESLQLIIRNVNFFRSVKNMSQETLAEHSGLSRNFLAKLESGSSNISITNLEKLAKGLGIRTIALLADDNEMLQLKIKLTK